MIREESTLMLEAIRAGIPTRNLISTLPDLRHDLIRVINKDLDNLAKGRKVKGRVIWGEYGQGKTHYLKVVEKHILEQGYAVSFLTLNRDLGLNKLEYLLPALSSHVLTKDNNIPGILNQLLDNPISPQSMDELEIVSREISHPLPWLILQSFLNYERDMILLYNALMGKKENVVRAKQIIKSTRIYDFKAMPKFVQKDHLIAFVEFFPYLLKCLGYKGWVILIDELEIIGRLGKVSRLNSYRNLSWLMNISGEHNLPIFTIAASAKTLQEDVFYGTKKRDAEEMPALASERFGVQIADRIENLFDLCIGEQGLVLKPINPGEYIPLMQTLLELHRSAIDWKHQVPDNMVKEALKHLEPANKPIRQVIRMFIESMDIYAVYGSLPQKFKEIMIEEYDLEEELPEVEQTEDDQPGLKETPFKDMFDF